MVSLFITRFPLSFDILHAFVQNMILAPRHLSYVTFDLVPCTAPAVDLCRLLPGNAGDDNLHRRLCLYLPRVGGGG